MALPPVAERVLLSDIIKKFSENYLLADHGVIPLLVAVFIANKSAIVEHPVWLGINAPSSGGKTELLDLFADLQHEPYKLTYHIGDLTPNTFISGFVNKKKNPSLLKQLNGKVVFIKDFTTILQKNPEARREIMAQLREIYDGEFNKDFGTGDPVHWTGRVGIICAMTPHGLDMMTEFSTMGERFINYYLEQPDPNELAKMLKEKYSQPTGWKKEVREMMAKYISYYVMQAELLDATFAVDEDTLDDINKVAMFATRARSVVKTDFRTGDVIDIPVFEGMGRFSKQLQSIAKSFCLMNDSHKITDEQKKIIYKVAFDSIPRKMRAVLRVLAEYKQTGTSGIASKLGPQTATVRSWLSQLVALQLVQRIPKGGIGNEDGWKLTDYAQKMMERFEGIKMSDQVLLTEDDAINATLKDGGMTPEQVAEKKAELDKEKKDSRVRAIMAERDIAFDEATAVYEEELKQEAFFDSLPDKPAEKEKPF